MYRILTASKDTYLTSKFIAGSRSLDSNVGQAGTLDLFALKDETFISASVSGTVELSRILIQFDYSELNALTSSILDVASPSFKCFMQLKDIYGGQTTPTNFNLRAIPLSRSWNEGRGFDVVSFRDIDSANFLTASAANGVPSLWFASGAHASGTMGNTSIDIITSGNIGSGIQDLTVTQTFSRGDEDLLMDITSLVSASVVGIIPNNGLRISFVDNEETDATTRFVKRFGSRHTLNKNLHPRLIVKYNDSTIDSNGNPQFNVSQSLFVYNVLNGVYTNFVSGSTSITGSNSLYLRLVASRSITWTTSSWSTSHSASISYLTRSLYVLTQSFTGSQHTIHGTVQAGIYSASFNLSTAENIPLRSFLSGSTEQLFKIEWVSLDGTYVYAKDYLTFKKPLGNFSNTLEKNLVANIINLKQTYAKNEVTRLRVFIQNYNADIQSLKYAASAPSAIFTNMKWRLKDAFTKEIVIPFDSTGTLCSTDKDGMFFDLYMNDLDANEVYEIEFLITEGGKDYFINNEGFRFKVVE